jgi:hypothetical protein
MADLIEQVSEATATSEDGDHVVVLYQSNFIRSEEGLKSVQQASGRLQLGEWEPVAATCGLPECCRPDHLVEAHLAKDEEDLQLVAAHAISLADLYRKGRSRGLLTARSEYGG